MAKQSKIYLLAFLCLWFVKEINISVEDLHETPVHFQKAVGNHCDKKIAGVLRQSFSISAVAIHLL